MRAQIALLGFLLSGCVPLRETPVKKPEPRDAYECWVARRTHFPFYVDGVYKACYRRSRFQDIVKDL